jgi:hypothetical protein
MNAHPFTHDISGTIHLLFSDANSYSFGARPNVILRMSAGQLVRFSGTDESLVDLARHSRDFRSDRSISDQRSEW